MRTRVIIMKTKNILSIGVAWLVALSLVPLDGVAAPTCDEETADDSVLSGDSGGSGAVYLMTNQVPNAITVFDRGHDGTLTMVGTFPTGGDGNPVPQPGDPPTDPLGSQGSLILSPHFHFLFAVNAGSNEISVMRVMPHGLTLVEKVPSGGTRPISVTANSNFLYVLNEGGTPNITGFRFDNQGHLTPLAGSTRPLSGGADVDPAEVGFSARGDVLAVTEKHSNIIDTYTVGHDGIPTGPVTTASHGMTPFGFAFDNCANLIVSEAFGGAPNQSAVSSYHLKADGTLDVTSGSIPDTQTAACWIVIANRGRTVFTTNTGSGTVSSYEVHSGGVLSLANAVAADLGTGSSPIDMALEKNGRFLYVHAAGAQAIKLLRVGSDGGLTLLSSTGGLPLGAQGIAAR